jgi:hypothetical protein
MLTLDRSAVASSPEALGGTLVFRGSRVPVQTLLDYQAYGGQDGGQALLRGAYSGGQAESPDLAISGLTPSD